MNKKINKMKQKIIIISYIIALIATIFMISHFFLGQIKSQIYFDTWYNQIKQKNEVGKFLAWKDTHYNYQIERGDKYKIDKNRYIELKDILVSLEYAKVNKTMNIYLNIFDPRTELEVKYKDLPESTSSEICKDILSILSGNQFIVEGNKNSDVTKNHINFINFYFTFNMDEMAEGEPVGGLIYQRSKEEGSFNFEFLEIFNNADFS